MFDPSPILISAESIPDWMVIGFFAFWAGLPAIARFLLNVKPPAKEPPALTRS